jgi:SAM-dependent methyltransferase
MRLTGFQHHHTNHLKNMVAFYESAPVKPKWLSRRYRKLLAHYYNLHLHHNDSVLEVGCGGGWLLERLHGDRKVGLDLSSKQLAKAREVLPEAEYLAGPAELTEPIGPFSKIIISDTLNQAADVQFLLTSLHRQANVDTRLITNFFSSLWRPVLNCARKMGCIAQSPESSWLSTQDVLNLMDLSGWEAIKIEPRLILPLPLFGLDRLANRFITPILPFLSLTVFIVARPFNRKPQQSKVSVIIPARNESGNIEDAVRRTPPMGKGTEIIFVEGGSSDDTWAKIQQVVETYPNDDIKAIQQTGKGKGNAVDEGFANATGDIFMILDADLTVPPEDLPKFYFALVEGIAEFANGVRLVYPMEDHAMRFLNMCANKFFSIAFSWILGQPVKDTLCGTKALTQRHYHRIIAHRSYFGNFDPFGDFDLLFGASKLDLKIVDIPIRYRERIYGETNINRWRHGLLLFQMLFYAARKLKFV